MSIKILIILLPLMLIFLFPVALLFYRGIRLFKLKNVNKVDKKYEDIIQRLTKANVPGNEDIMERLKSIGDLRVIEILLDKAMNLEGHEFSHYPELYDATGLTDHYIEILSSSKSWKERALAAKKLGLIGSVRSVPQLLSVIKDIKDEDEDVRGAALRALGRIKDKRAVPYLIELLGYPETWLPPRIGEILVSIGEESIEPLLKEINNYQSESRRSWAVEILGWLEAKIAIVPIIAALSDISPEVRAKAAGSLGKLKDNRAVGKLLEVLISDPVPFVRVRASQALGAIGNPEAIDYLTNVLKDPEWWVRVRAVEALEQMGDRAVSALLIALEDEDKEVRKRAGMALERLGYVEKVLEEYGQKEFRPDIKNILFLIARSGVIESLSEKLISSEGDLRKRIVRLLGDAGAKEASGSLIELLIHTSEWTLKARIIQSLGKMGAKEVIPYLVECLKDNEYWVRRSTVEALGILEAIDVVDDIAMILDDPNPVAREAALTALSRLKATKHEKKIEALLDDPSPRVRSMAMRVSRELGLSIDINKTFKLITDISEEARIEAMRMLSELRDKTFHLDIMRFLPLGSDAIRHEVVEYVRKVQPAGFQQLLEVLDINRLQKEAIGSLIDIASTIKDKEAYQFIIKYTDNDDYFLREKAYHGINNLGMKIDEKIIKKGLIDKSGIVRMRVLIGISGSKKHLLKYGKALMNDPDENVRVALALVLGVSGYTDFKPFLIELLEDPAIRVVSSTLFSLASIGDPIVIDVINSKGNIKHIKEGINNITQDTRFKTVVERIREKSRKSKNLEIDFLLEKDEKEYAISLVRRVSEDPDPDRRLKAMEMLKKIATSESFTSILGILKYDPIAEVRTKAMDVLSSLGRDDEVISAFSSMLADPSLHVRIKAAELLGGYKTPNAIEALSHTLDTSDRQLREAVTTVLSKQLKEDPGKLREMITNMPETKTRKLGMIWIMGKMRKSGSLKYLTTHLGDSDPDIRASAVGALGKFKGKQLLNYLEKAVYDPNERVRAAAVNAITVIGGHRAFEIVEVALEDIDDFVKMRAIIGLVKLDLERSVSVLRAKGNKIPELHSYMNGILYAEGLLYKDSFPKDLLAKMIVQELYPEEEMIKDLKSSPDENRRIRSIRVLAFVHGDNCRDLLSTSLKDPSTKVRETIENVLQDRTYADHTGHVVLCTNKG